MQGRACVQGARVRQLRIQLIGVVEAVQPEMPILTAFEIGLALVDQRPFGERFPLSIGIAILTSITAMSPTDSSLAKTLPAPSEPVNSTWPIARFTSTSADR